MSYSVVSKMFSFHEIKSEKPDENSLIIKDEESMLPESATVDEIQKPIEKESSHKWFLCKFCSYKSLTKKYLNLHISNKHTNLKPENCIRCPNCEFKAETVPILKQHMKKHDLEKWFHCDKCPYTSSKKSNLESHKLNKHTKCVEIKYNLVQSYLSPYTGKSRNNSYKHKETKNDLSTSNEKSEEENENIELLPTIDTLQCSFCPFIGQTTKCLKNHIHSVHETEKILKCDHCSLVVKNETLLVDHIVTKHTCTVSYSSDKISHFLDVTTTENNLEPKNIKCDRCPMHVASVELLSKHLLIHGEKIYICSECSYIARHKRILTTHIRTTHGQNNSTPKFPCFECGYKTNNKRDLKVHNLIHIRLGKFTCYSCALFFENDIYLRVHLRLCHPQNGDLNKRDEEIEDKDEEMRDCSQSSIYIKTEEEIVQNVLQSEDGEVTDRNVDPLSIEEFEDGYYVLDTPGYQKRFFCKRCSHQSVTNYDMKKHIDYKHAKPEDIIWMNCPLCPYVARSTYLWSKHLKQRHSNVEPEKNNIHHPPRSNIDDTEFIIEEGPDGRKHFWCMYCSFEAFYDIHMKNHIKLQHRLQCPRCPLKGKTIEHLAKHLSSTHKVEKTFNCDQCSFKTTTETLLVDHIVQEHTDCDSKTSQILYKLLATREKNKIQCSKCSYSLSSNELLQKHMLLHGEKIYSCTKCAYFSRQQRILDIHDFDVHCAYKNHFKLPCSQCGYKTHRKDDLKKHEMMYHSKFGNFTCMACSLIFTSGVYLKVHLKMCHASSNNSNVVKIDPSDQDGNDNSVSIVKVENIVEIV